MKKNINPPNKRLPRLASVIKEEIAKILLQWGDDQPKALLTVLDTQISSDRSHAVVFISIYPATQSRTMLAWLKNNLWDIQQTLNQRLPMRPVPKIRFSVDTSIAAAEKLRLLLKKNG